MTPSVSKNPAGGPAPAGPASAGLAPAGPVSAGASSAGAPSAGAPGLAVEGLQLGYGHARIVHELSTHFAPGRFTAVIGPNGCGKSTLLRALARLLKPQAGRVMLDGRDANDWKPKDYARQVALLSQEATAPSGITVAGLVARGRFPHQGMFSQWTRQDEEVVHRALSQTGVLELATQRVSDLSGGQRQRVRVATTLAQRAGILLLDEPTTFLDVAHQVDLLDLFAAQRDAGSTVIAVLHDINQAIRYADELLVMAAGRVVAQGAPQEVVTAELLREVFAVESQIHADPVTGGPLMITVPSRR